MARCTIYINTPGPSANSRTPHPNTMTCSPACVVRFLQVQSLALFGHFGAKLLSRKPLFARANQQTELGRLQRNREAGRQTCTSKYVVQPFQNSTSASVHPFREQQTTRLMSEELESLSPAVSLLFPSLGPHLLTRAPRLLLEKFNTGIPNPRLPFHSAQRRSMVAFTPARCSESGIFSSDSIPEFSDQRHDFTPTQAPAALPKH